MELGRLEKVSLREAWGSESSDFTPWMAQEENLKLLGDTIGLDLEPVAQEKNVGPFFADLLCKDTSTGNWVLIENQLEKTDHDHLGKLLTYSAGLHAVTIVWVAQRFVEEHRAALDWLNDITDEKFSFFGLAVELWRIGDSVAAPKFNIVSKPNDWSKSVTGAAGSFSLAQPTETQQLQLKFWTALREYFLDHNSPLKCGKPWPGHWIYFSIGRSSFSLSASFNSRDRKLICALTMDGPDAKPHYHLLRRQVIAIEKEIGTHLMWREMPGKKSSQISTAFDGADLTNENRWPEYQKWFAEGLETFHKVFSQRVKQLDASQYIPDAEDSVG